MDFTGQTMCHVNRAELLDAQSLEVRARSLSKGRSMDFSNLFGLQKLRYAMLQIRRHRATCIICIGEWKQCAQHVVIPGWLLFRCTPSTTAVVLRRTEHHLFCMMQPLLCIVMLVMPQRFALRGLCEAALVSSKRSLVFPSRLFDFNGEQSPACSW